jgi:hypothetical protein
MEDVKRLFTVLSMGYQSEGLCGVATPHNPVLNQTVCIIDVLGL